jgi:hypothetical protein
MSRKLLCAVTLAAIAVSGAASAAPRLSYEQKLNGFAAGYFRSGAVEGSFAVIEAADGKGEVVTVYWSVDSANWTRGCLPISSLRVRGDEVSIDFDAAKVDDGRCDRPHLEQGDPGRWVGTFTLARGAPSYVIERRGSTDTTSVYPCSCEGGTTCRDHLNVDGFWRQGTASFVGTVGGVTVAAAPGETNGYLDLLNGLWWSRTYCEAP